MPIDVTASSASAVAYISASDADAYFAARAIATWTGTDAAKEAALVRGADYLDRRYAGQWVGIRTLTAQSMAWPRTGVVDHDGLTVDHLTVPEVIRRANAEAALLILTGTDLEPVLAGGVKREKVKAGPVETETEYLAGSAVRQTITAIDGLLAGYVRGLSNSGGQVELMRV